MIEKNDNELIADFMGLPLTRKQFIKRLLNSSSGIIKTESNEDNRVLR